MRRIDLLYILRKGPFRPFRLFLSDGSTFEIRHPEMLMVGNHSAVIGYAEGADNGSEPETYPEIDRFAMVDLVHVTRIESLQGQSA